MDTDHAYDEAMYMSVRLVDMNILYLILAKYDSAWVYGHLIDEEHRTYSISKVYCVTSFKYCITVVQNVSRWQGQR